MITSPRRPAQALFQETACVLAGLAAKTGPIVLPTGDSLKDAIAAALKASRCSNDGERLAMEQQVVERLREEGRP